MNLGTPRPSHLRLETFGCWRSARLPPKR